MNKKVICTLGPSSLDPETIQRLDSLKVDLFRLNLSHTPVDQIEPLAELIRANSSVPICLDTQGSQARTGSLPGGTMELSPGFVVELVSDGVSGESGSFLPIQPASLLYQLAVNDLISVDFGSAMIQVIEIGSRCFAQTVYGGTAGSNKALSIVGTSIDLPPLTESDYKATALALQLGIDFIALSFANSKEDVQHLRSLVGPNIRIIAKVESWDGLDNLDGILEVADSVLIDRGDLSREVALETLPFAQKEIIGRANAAGVPVYVATNLLESMVTSPRPTRAEVNDVMNTLIDGADGLVLAAETAIGEYPVQCVRMIQGLIHQYEGRQSFPQQAATPPSSGLITPHGGRLVEHILYDYDMADLKELPALEVDKYEITDIYQLAVGAYSPLSGFMDREELESVLDKNRLPGGSVWTMPILLQLPEINLNGFSRGETIALTSNGEIQALIKASDCYSFDLHKLANRWFGTADIAHPGVARLLAGTGRFLAGQIEMLSGSYLRHQPYELSPRQTRLLFDHLLWERVVGFHTRNACHRGHEFIQLTAMANTQSDGLFIHPVVGPKKSGDFSGDIILKTYQKMIRDHYPPNRAVLGGFVSYSRYAGPREAVFTALCRQNFGCSHFIIGRDHTGVGDHYAPNAAQRLFDEVGDMGITPVFFDEVYYCDRCQSHVESCSHGADSTNRISGTVARETLNQGEILPEWYMREALSRLIIDEIKAGAQVFTP